MNKWFSDILNVLERWFVYKKGWIILYFGVLFALIILCFKTCGMSTSAFDPTAPVLISTTAYTAGVAGTGTVTASGAEVRYGIVASSKEMLGYTAIIYENNDGKIGDVIGIFEVKDTGYGKTESNGKGSIQNLNCIDVYMETLDEVWEWMEFTGGKVFVQFIWAEG